MSLWSNLQKREQLAVMWGGGILLLLLVYVMVIAPLRSDLARMKKEVVVQKADLVWMQDAAVRARQLKSVRKTARSGVSPLKMIDQTARRFGIDSSLKRVDPGEGDKIKVWFEDLVFVDFMQFLRGAGDNRELSVDNLMVERLNTPGIVNARVTFKAETE